MAALNVALIGQGFMGKAHSNAYAQVGHFFPELRKVRRKVVCGRNRERLAAFAKTWEWEQVETDWRRIVERDDIDIVDICTPNALHAEMAVAAAEAGKMALCEKPAANNAVEAAAMAEAAKGVPNMVWFNYRRVPAVELARQLVHEGKLGRIFQYRAAYLQEWGNDFTRPAAWRLSKAAAGSGANGDLNSHLIDTAMMMLGPIREVSATMETFFDEKPDPSRPGETYPVDVDDTVLTQARFANGTLATFEATRFAVGVRNANRFEITRRKRHAALRPRRTQPPALCRCVRRKATARHKHDPGHRSGPSLRSEDLAPRALARIRAHVYRRAGRLLGRTRKRRAGAADLGRCAAGTTRTRCD